MRFKKTNALMLVAFCCLQAPLLNGQTDFFQPNAKWVYAFRVPFGQFSGHFVFAYVGDTTLIGRDSRIINRTTYYSDFDDPTIPLDTVEQSPLYFSQSGDSILYYTGDDFKLLWRTQLSPGDSFVIPDQFAPYTVGVDSSINTVVDGQSVVKSWISGSTMYGLPGSDIIYDIFGPRGGFFYYSCWGFFDCYPPSLCRYQNSIIGEVMIEGYNCENVVSSSTNLYRHNISIYPNPNSGSFFVQLTDESIQNVKIEIFSITGQQIASQELQSWQGNEVILPAVPTGYYICKIQSDVSVFITRFLVQ